MARVFPFQPYRYTSAAGDLNNLVTQPYDKISSEMQKRYLSISPYNLVRVILGEKHASDSDSDNVYTRATNHLKEWIEKGMLAKEDAPSFYAYFQDFEVPDTGERLTRKGFIGIGGLEEYSANVVHRHEQTLSGPKKDRTELLRHTQSHFGQIFMLYPDPQGEIDKVLDEAAQGEPLATIQDEYGATHRYWKISEPARIQRIQQLMSDKKLLIADGHHRYETALQFHKDNPQLQDASGVMMTFVNMNAPGVKILATHRLVSNIPNFNVEEFLRTSAVDFSVTEVGSLEELRELWDTAGVRTRIGVAVGDKLYCFEHRDLENKLDVTVLHEILLGQVLGIGEEAVKGEKNLKYVRGADKAIEMARKGEAQIAFLLKPISVEQVAEISFSGGVMPQKSTDFYPKLLSGLTIYRIEK